MIIGGGHISSVCANRVGSCLKSGPDWVHFHKRAGELHDNSAIEYMAGVTLYLN